MKTLEHTKMLNDLVLDRIQRSIEVKQALLKDATFRELLTRAALEIVKSLRAGGKVLFFGNGGSAADAQDIAAELVGRYKHEGSALPAVALTANSSSITAIGNDYGFEEIFARQIRVFGFRRRCGVGNAYQRQIPQRSKSVSCGT